MLSFHLARTACGRFAMLALAVGLGVAKPHPAGALEVKLKVTDHTTGKDIMN
jgi:hypothetical protein